MAIERISIMIEDMYRSRVASTGHDADNGCKRMTRARSSRVRMQPSSSSSNPIVSPTTYSYKRSQHPRKCIAIVSIVASLVLFPSFRQRLDYSTFYNRSMELLVDYPPILQLQAQQFTNSSHTLQRPRLDRSTFFYTGVSQEDIQKYFYWDPDSIFNASAIAVEPMWSCHDVNHRRTKLIFHHMPKSGGITIRALLKGYSMLCNASIAMVSQCTFLGREFMDGIYHWTNGHDTKHAKRSCLLATAINRSGHVVTTEERLSTSLLQEHDFDVLAGHLPLGSDEFWMDSTTGQHVSVQNLVFFRKPLERFVSQFMVGHRGDLGGMTTDDTVGFIHEAVQNRTARGEHYELYSRTLIRPEQRSWVEQQRIPWASEQRLNLTLRNMVESRVVVGILERLGPSIELIRHLLDNDRQVPDFAFDYFNSDKLAKRLALFHGSGNQTKRIVERIEQDPSMRAVFDEYLKFEQAAYDWAIRIHELQIDAMDASYPAMNISAAGS